MVTLEELREGMRVRLTEFIDPAYPQDYLPEEDAIIVGVDDEVITVEVCVHHGPEDPDGLREIDITQVKEILCRS